MGRLSSIASDVWIIRAPLRFRGAPIGRISTVIRLPDGQLVVHSPAPLDDELRVELDRLGKVCHLVAPSSLHGHTALGEYVAAYPRARLLAAPGLAERRRDLAFAGALGEEPDRAWHEIIDQHVIRGHRLAEVAILHRPSATLVLGDSLFAIGPTAPLRARLFAWGPRLRPRVGPTPLWRRNVRDRLALRASIDALLDWPVQRIVPGHGEILQTDAREVLREAYIWL